MEKECDYIHNYLNQTEAQVELSSCRYSFALSTIETDLIIDEKLKWLDIGSNIGVGLPECNTNITLIASDIDRRYLSLQNNPYSKINFDAVKIPFKNESCDVISCFETIEHINLKEVYKLLPEINRVLKEDGILFLSTPNKDANGKRKICSDHKQEFNLVELVSILDKFGFEIEENFGQNIVNNKNFLHQLFLNIRQSPVIGHIYDSMPSFLINYVRNESINAFGGGEIRKTSSKETERIIYLLCRKKF